MHFFKATLIAFLYVSCISAAPLDAPLDKASAVDQVLKTHGTCLSGNVVDTVPHSPHPRSAGAPSAAQIAAAKLTTSPCATMDEHQPEQASPRAAGSKAYTFNVSFLGIFEMEGSIDMSTLVISSTLYVRVPLWGRVKLISISGPLREGIKLSINVLVAQGTMDLRLDGKDVRILVDLNVKFIGKIKDDVKLFTLPDNAIQPNVD